MQLSLDSLKIELDNAEILAIGGLRQPSGFFGFYRRYPAAFAHAPQREIQTNNQISLGVEIFAIRLAIHADVSQNCHREFKFREIPSSLDRNLPDM